MQAKDLMTRDVVTVSPETPVAAVAQRLVDRRISAVPVVDATGTVLGIVSEGDLLRRRELGTERRSSWWLEVFADPDSRARDYTKAHGLTAADVMTSPVVCAEETALSRRSRTCFRRTGSSASPCSGRERSSASSAAPTSFGRSRRAPRAPSDGETDDRAIERKLRERMAAESWARSGFVNVVVRDGTVELWGFARSEEQRQGLRVLAQEVPGVRKVEDHLTVGHLANVP